ncbi:diguanylate cyclase domain-containing protein [Catenuloplanes atrovinosus]|uniref:Diguanylate cyclase (GGDEF)-like protein n=1 Tax=Catenuloplanes atrovinosus TaxID=137266 RepID=A0AAE3YSC7_9ACTN|nr:diguanylate cyclase [Catenuloplanes atrovinosus]MDR7278332.1 diguanylate cyclase (GGDEF)-like protein [Catenuloplanes atrovinosus]
MPARFPGGRGAARTAIVGLALSLLALAALAMASNLVMQRATSGVGRLNQISDEWGQVFQSLNAEQDAMRDYLRAGSDVGREPLASAIGGGEPHLLWLAGHADADDRRAVTVVLPAYRSYGRTLRQLIELSDGGADAQVRLQAGQADLAEQALRKQITAQMDRTRLETTAFLESAERQNDRLRTASLIMIVLVLLPLGLSAAVLVGYQRRIEGQAEASRHQALHDPLTGLANRLLLHEQTDRAVREAARHHDRIALLLIDLNRFKEVNDTLGHAVGDLLLQRVAERLRSAVRDSDTPARLGGDEFAVLLPRLSAPGDALLVARRIADAFGEPIVLGDGQVLRTHGSIGISIFPTDAADASQLLQHADIAMYAAKRAGLGPTIYTDALDEEPVAL